MSATYNVNGQQMTEEEFRKWQQDNGFDFGFSGGFHRRQKQQWDGKMHLYQCYKNTQLNSWLEISSDEFKRDMDKLPKFKKKLYYVQKDGRDYIVIESPVVAVFYNHIEDIFLYMKEGGIIEEKNCFKTEEEALKAIHKLEKEKENTHTLYDASGNIIMSYKPETPNES